MGHLEKLNRKNTMTKHDLIKRLEAMPENLPIKYYKGHIDRVDVVLPIKDIRLVLDDDSRSPEEDIVSKPLYILIY
jgi:hypothetical protein